MMIRPMIPAQTASIPDTTDLVDLIKVPLVHFQASPHTSTPPEIETQTIDDSELFTQNLITILTFGMCILTNVSQ